MNHSHSSLFIYYKQSETLLSSTAWCSFAAFLVCLWSTQPSSSFLLKIKVFFTTFLMAKSGFAPKQRKADWASEHQHLCSHCAACVSCFSVHRDGCMRWVMHGPRSTTTHAERKKEMQKERRKERRTGAWSRLLDDGRLDEEEPRRRNE